jgi:hypothetical protein
LFNYPLKAPTYVDDILRADADLEHQELEGRALLDKIMKLLRLSVRRVSLNKKDKLIIECPTLA